MAERAYAVTYMTKDGQERSEVVMARNHSAVERKITALGGTIMSLERDEEDTYPRKTRALRRTIGCFTIVILALMLAIALFWIRTHGRM